jgi:hypothetical protein
MVMGSQKRFDGWSLLVMALTLVLFLIPLFTVGLTHDLLLEAGVFLVFVKLILVLNGRIDLLQSSLNGIVGGAHLVAGHCAGLRPLRSSQRVLRAAAR